MMFEEWPIPTHNAEFSIAPGCRERRGRPPVTQPNPILANNDATPTGLAQATFGWATNAALKFTWIAPDLAEQLRISPVDAIGQSLLQYFKLNEDEDWSLPLLSALMSEMNFSGQKAVARTGDGATMLLSGYILRDQKGGFGGFVGRALLPARALAMVTPNLREDNADTACLDRTRLRTPLDAIVSAAYKIVRRSDGPLGCTHVNYMTNRTAAGPHLASITRKMDVSVISLGQVDLVAASSEAVFLISSSGVVKGVAVDIMASSRVVACGDKLSIVQIVVDILRNAVQHSPSGEAVVISISEKANRALLTVTDRRPGIMTHDDRRVLEHCKRLSTAELEVVFGRALRLARRMGGDIQHQKNSSGEGMRFTLDLPLCSRLDSVNQLPRISEDALSLFDKMSVSPLSAERACLWQVDESPLPADSEHHDA